MQDDNQRETPNTEAQAPHKDGALGDLFAPVVTYHEWEADPIWQKFLKQQKRFKRPRTELVNELMYSVPDGTRREFLRRISRASKCDNAIEFERHSLGVAFTMQRLSLMMVRRKKIMHLSSEPLRIEEQEPYMSYGDENTPPRQRNLTIVDNFTLYRNDEPFIYKAKYTPVRQFGEIDPKSKDPYYDYDQLLKYNEAIERKLICGAAIEIRGLIDPDFMEWACGTSVFERSNIPHVQLIYNMPLPSGAEYRFTFKKSESFAEELLIENDMSQFTPEDLEIIQGIENALKSGNQFQLTEIMTGQGVFSEKGSLTQQFQSFTCPAREEELKNPEYYDNYIAMMRRGIWRRAANIKPENYNHTQDTVFSSENAGIEDDYDALKERIEAFQEELRSQGLKINSCSLGDDPESDEYKSLLHQATLAFSENIRRIKSTEEQRRLDEQNNPNITAYRKNAGWVGLDEGYTLDLYIVMVDSIDNVRNQHFGGKEKSYDNPHERFMDARNVLDLLESRQDQRSVDMMTFSPYRKDKRQFHSNPDQGKIDKEIKTARQENVKAFVKYFEDVEQGQKKLSGNEKSTYRERKPQILAVQSEIALVLKQKIELSKQLGPASKTAGVKRLPEEHPLRQEIKALDLRKEELDAKLLDVYCGILSPKKEQALLRHVHVQEKNIIKLVYAVDHQGNITFDEEKQKTNGRADRASHSELVGGGNVYGAGEIILEKPPGSKEWHIIEINNGSGHYRPPSDTLRFVSNCLIDNLRAAYQARGAKPYDAEMQMRQMMSKARLTDTIARGITLRDQERDLRQKLQATGQNQNPVAAKKLPQKVIP